MLPKILITCYYVTSLIQERNLKLYPETEKRLRQICPTVAVTHGELVLDGTIETLLNFLDGSEGGCVQEEEKYLRRIGLRCDDILTPQDSL